MLLIPQIDDIPLNERTYTYLSILNKCFCLDISIKKTLLKTPDGFRILSSSFKKCEVSMVQQQHHKI